MNKIESVELYSVGGLCEKDLTGSCHLVIATYEDKTKKIIQLEAGFWQKKSSQHRNSLFPEILGEIMPGCIILSHEHLDHTGRLVKMHKALKEAHMLAGVPIIMSEASRKLLPHVLKAIHHVSADSLGAFDQSTSRFESKWTQFKREYLRKPTKTQPRGTDHRPDGDRRAEKKRDNTRRIDELKQSFEDWGGIIEIDGEMIVPLRIGKQAIGQIHRILRDIKKLQKPENSGVLSTNESSHFKNMKDELAQLFLEGEVFETLDKIFEEELPRQKRRERDLKIQEARKILDASIAHKRKSLLPDITEEDIDICIGDARGTALENEFDLPGIPHAVGTLHHTGHMLGAVSVELVFKMTGGRVKKLLFSGDVGSWNKPTLHGMPILPQKTVDRVIMESTYAGRKHTDIAMGVEKIVEFIRAHRGPILMPVFALDRLFVVLDALQDEIISGRIKCPIYSRNRLGEGTQPIYQEYYPKLTEVLSHIITLSGPEGGRQAYEAMGGDEDCLILASGGTLIESSSAHGLLQHRAETGKNICMIFTGYQPGELGAEIMHFVLDPLSEQKKIIRIGAYEAEIDKDNISCPEVFSGHGDHGDLERFSQIGKVVSLIHGNPATAPILAKSIGADILPRETYTRIF